MFELVELLDKSKKVCVRTAAFLFKISFNLIVIRSPYCWESRHQCLNSHHDNHTANKLNPFHRKLTLRKKGATLLQVKTHLKKKIFNLFSFATRELFFQALHFNRIAHIKKSQPENFFTSGEVGFKKNAVYCNDKLHQLHANKFG